MSEIQETDTYHLSASSSRRNYGLQPVKVPSDFLSRHLLSGCNHKAIMAGVFREFIEEDLSSQNLLLSASKNGRILIRNNLYMRWFIMLTLFSCTYLSALIAFTY